MRRRRRAALFAQEEFTGRYAKDPNFFKEYRARIGAVTAADTAGVRKKYLLDLDKLVVLAVGTRMIFCWDFRIHPAKFQDLWLSGIYWSYR